jgi:hypothetical protein
VTVKNLRVGPACQSLLRPRLASRPRSPTGGPRLSMAYPASRSEPFIRTTRSPTSPWAHLSASSPPPTSSTRHGRPWEHKTPSTLLSLCATAPANHPTPSPSPWTLSSPADHRCLRHRSSTPLSSPASPAVSQLLHPFSPFLPPSSTTVLPGDSAALAVDCTPRSGPPPRRAWPVVRPAWG